MKEKTKVEVEYVGNEDEIKEVEQVCMDYDDDIKFTEFARCKLRKLKKGCKRIVKSRFGKTLGAIGLMAAGASVGGIIVKNKFLNNIESTGPYVELTYDAEKDAYVASEPTTEDETTVETEETEE